VTGRGREDNRLGRRIAFGGAFVVALLLPQLSSGGGLAVLWRTTVAKTGDCEVTVTVPIEIHGSAASQALADQWQAEMEHKWNGPTAEMVAQLGERHGLDPRDPENFERLDEIARRMMAAGGVPTDATMVDCCTIKFVFDVRVRGEEATRGYHQIEAVPEFEEREVRGKTRKFRVRDFVRGASGAHYFDRTGRWGAGSGEDSAAAHEVGHLMGLGDEYDDTHIMDTRTGKPAIDRTTGKPMVIGSKPKEGHESDVMADDPHSGWPTEDGIRKILALGRVSCNCCPDADSYADSSWLMERVDNAGSYLEDAIEISGTAMLEGVIRSLEMYEGSLAVAANLSWFDRSFLEARIAELKRRANEALEGKPADDRANAPVSDASEYLDLLDFDPTWINPPGTEGPRNPLVQIMIIGVSSDVASSGITVPNVRQPLPQGALGPPFGALSAWWEPVQQGGISMFLTSLGNSSGEAFTGQFVNSSGTAATMFIDGLVIEPMQAAAQEAARAGLSRLSGLAVSRTLDAFCMQPLAAPPSAGTMFRAADQALQEQAAPLRRVLRAANRVQQAGLLNPDSDPTAYFTSIRQWALWSQLEGHDLGSFTEAFLEHTRDNAVAAGLSWNDDVAELVRSAAPGRWMDIQTIFDHVR